MNNKKILNLSLIALIIVICLVLAKDNVELNNKLLDTKSYVKVLVDENMCLEKTISDLNLELSITNEKISNMISVGIPAYFTEEEVSYIAKTVYGEAGCCSKIQQSAVVWCILNRVDNGYWGSTIKSVVTAPGQFNGYHSYNPVTDEIKELVEDIIVRWNMEKNGMTNIGRTLPERFMYFHADGTGFANRFTTSAGTGEVWTWDCWNPYE